ncbi:MAG TPA: PepSY-associated TM helix domain-containing protein [Bacteroidia bacterium]|nr:PepSY-associated TM helix domain-containing protein [Bacteroidia bacterium]
MPDLSVSSPTNPKIRRKSLKTVLTKQFYVWHWVSSAICLASMVFFTFTGLTLNHAADIPANLKKVSLSYELSAEHLEQLRAGEDAGQDEVKPLPSLVAAHLGSHFDEKLRNKNAEWSEDEIYLSLPRPGGDAWLSIDRETGEVTYERTTRGGISFLNDLHKGRHTGSVWFWFIDVFSVAALVFTLTGVGLLWVHARRRPSTWPLVIAGLLLPIVLIVFFIH